MYHVVLTFHLVDGGFSGWTQWTQCSEECGKGQRNRTRTCSNPTPAHGGSDCVGDTVQTEVCKIKECPGEQL